ncbi:hypothetical protein [Allokutzneria sp. NRRL B-24872]|uniref:hypothetical protein n=1 Tax=Allokutzneria sp. NRRL B-24872 TaxID=1137961 RepID=UPI001178C056|nr:hypothetical protein [Allokutzneria sp. NRRL B-24872]
MSSCRELAARLRGIAVRLPVDVLRRAAVNAHDAAVGVLAAQGERDTPLNASAAALQQAAGSAERLVWAATWIESCCTKVLGVVAEASAPVHPPAPDVYAAAAVPRLFGSKPPSATDAYSTRFKAQPALATPSQYETRLQRSDETTFGMPPDRTRGAEITRLAGERDGLERDSDGLITHVMGERVEDHVRRISEQRAVIASHPQRHWSEANPGVKPPAGLRNLGMERVCSAIGIDLRTGLLTHGVNGKLRDVVPDERPGLLAPGARRQRWQSGGERLRARPLLRTRCARGGQGGERVAAGTSAACWRPGLRELQGDPACIASISMTRPSTSSNATSTTVSRSPERSWRPLRTAS